MPIITISRGSFSGGKAVAEALGQRLGQPVLSREELLAYAGREFGISEAELTAALNQPPPFWQQVLGKRLTYVKCLTAGLLEHARSGNLIYHGNVGHLLLAGVPKVLSVRVIAGMDRRVESAIKQAGLTRDQAVAHIHRVDKERSRWAQVLYGVNVEDPVQYDLVVNLERMTPGAAAETIAQMSSREEFQPSDASRQALEDTSLGCRVWAALAKSPTTRSATVEVSARDGNVVITGNISSTKTGEAIAEAARAVAGVKTLRCEAGMGADWHW